MAKITARDEDTSPPVLEEDDDDMPDDNEGVDGNVEISEEDMIG